MPTRDSRAMLSDELERFQADVERLARSAVEQIVRAELARKRALEPKRAPVRGRPAKRAAASSDGAASDAAAARAAASQLALPLGDGPAAAGPSTISALPPSGKRARWTRDTIADTLAGWIVSGTAIDAAFLRRHGPPGLVAAAIRVFGRFDAALNVAALRVSTLYPDGPPSR